MFRKLLGIGPTIGEIQAQHMAQARECLKDAMGTNDQREASRLWGEACHHMNESGWRGASSWPDDIQEMTTKFLTQQYDPLRESQRSSSLAGYEPQAVQARESQRGGYYREEIQEEQGGWFRRRHVVREGRR